MDFFHPHLDLPPGETKDSIFQQLSDFQVEDGTREEMQRYLQEHILRFLYTYSIMPKGEGTLLEIGSNPYYMSLIIKSFTNYQLHCCNYFAGNSGDEDRIQKVINTQTGERVEFKYKHVNVENYSLPYKDSYFDVVMFCEVIEHLANDPMFAIMEIKRVLKPEGIMVLTTPNVNRIENVDKIIFGANIYDPYSKHGIYGRHNREYSRHELFLLLTHCGFEFEGAFTSDSRPTADLNPKNLKKIMKLIRSKQNREYDLGHNIFIRARNTALAQNKKLGWLFTDYPPDETV